MFWVVSRSRLKAPPGTSSPYIYHPSHHRDNVTAPHGRPNLRGRLHFRHSQEGGPRKFVWTCSGIRTGAKKIKNWESRNILIEIGKRKANLISHIWRRNCHLKQVIEGKIKGEMEVTRRRGRRRKKLLDDLKKRRGYCHLKEEALDRTMWRNRFRGGFVPALRQTAKRKNCIYIYFVKQFV